MEHSPWFPSAQPRDAGNGNTAIGGRGPVQQHNWSQNTANGAFALLSNTIGAQNSAFGWKALTSNTGNENTATGDQALYQNRGHCNTPQFGLIAEEVAKVNPALVLPDKQGNHTLFVTMR